MRKDIHPKYYPEAKVYVGGELVGTVGSTKAELFLDVWSGTHPFYTGQQRIIDTEGQVDRFTKRLTKKASDAADKRAKEAKRRAKRQIAEVVEDDVAAEASSVEASAADTTDAAE
jgi:large subunit ribosomal protein L31